MTKTVIRTELPPKLTARAETYVKGLGGVFIAAFIVSCDQSPEPIPLDSDEKNLDQGMIKNKDSSNGVREQVVVDYELFQALPNGELEEPYATHYRDIALGVYGNYPFKKM